jgi:hypothetical protein
MSDCKTALISANLKTVLHNQTINYNGADQTTTAERQRTRLMVAGRYPYIEICGPWVEVQMGSQQNVYNKNYNKLFYQIEFRDGTINDDYDSETEVTPITELTDNIAAELIKLIMADRTRGGNATNTNVINYGYYFDADTEALEYVVYLTIEVTAFINATNPYLGG